MAFTNIGRRQYTWKKCKKNFFEATAVKSGANAAFTNMGTGSHSQEQCTRNAYRPHAGEEVRTQRSPIRAHNNALQISALGPTTAERCCVNAALINMGIGSHCQEQCSRNVIGHRWDNISAGSHGETAKPGN